MPDWAINPTWKGPELGIKKYLTIPEKDAESDKILTWNFGAT